MDEVQFVLFTLGLLFGNRVSQSWICQCIVDIICLKSVVACLKRCEVSCVTGSSIHIKILYCWKQSLQLYMHISVRYMGSDAVLALISKL